MVEEIGYMCKGDCAPGMDRSWIGKTVLVTSYFMSGRHVLSPNDNGVLESWTDDDVRQLFAEHQKEYERHLAHQERYYPHLK